MVVVERDSDGLCLSIGFLSVITLQFVILEFITVHHADLILGIGLGRATQQAILRQRSCTTIRILGG